MNTIYTSHYTAFAGQRRLARGSYDAITKALGGQPEPAEPVLVFDDATGALVDVPPRPEHAALLARLPNPPSAARDAAQPAGSRQATPGRPRLGVVAREVTLLPRHWEWLGAQRGGASAALRRLVDQARKSTEKADSRRQSCERGYKFMSAIAGHEPGFEEAARALFAADQPAFSACTAHWPSDVRTHLAELTQGAFNPLSSTPSQP